MKESRVLWMGDKDQILTTGFSAVSVCFFYVVDNVTYFQSNELTNGFYLRDAMLARVIVITTCPSVCPSRAGIVSKRRKLVA